MHPACQRQAVGHTKPNETQALLSETAAPKGSETGKAPTSISGNDKVGLEIQGGSCPLHGGEAVKEGSKEGPMTEASNQGCSTSEDEAE